jgi:sugar phosphate isomerase/epimerase
MKHNFPLLAVSSWSWHTAYYAGGWSLLDLPRTAVAAGLSAIECNDFMLPPPRLSRLRQPLLRLLPGAPPELWRYSRASLNQLRTIAQEQRVACLAWTINSDFAVPAGQWPAQQLYLWRGLSAARQLGVTLLRVNLGGAPDTGSDRDELIARRLAQFVRTSQQRLPGLMITLENHWGVSSDIDRHLHIFDAARAQLDAAWRPYFGCCFDPANMAESNQRPRWWPELAARANHFHLKTAQFDRDGRELSLPHAEIGAILQTAGYRGWTTIEYTGDGDPQSAVQRSVGLYANLGLADQSQISSGDH